MNKVRWTNHQYSTGATLNLGWGFKVVVMWNPLRSKGDTDPPFIVEVNGVRSKNKFNDFDKAKKYALAFAKKVIRELAERVREVVGQSLCTQCSECSE